MAIDLKNDPNYQKNLAIIHEACQEVGNELAQNIEKAFDDLKNNIVVKVTWE